MMNLRCIVFLVPGFPENESDDTCLPAVQNYVEAFSAAHPELETHVISFQSPYRRRTYRWMTATVHALGGRNRRKLLRIWTWIRAWIVFAQINRASGVTLIHSFWLTECTWVGRRLARLYRLPHVASVVGQDARSDNPFLNHLNLEKLVITAGSEFASEMLRQSSGRGADHIIPLGLDAHRMPRAIDAAERDLDIVGVGSMIPLKDYATFVDIVSALVSDNPGIRACIVGGGPGHELLQSHIAAAGLEDHLELRGSLPRNETLRVMTRGRVFLHTARYEAQGYVFLEALALGLPIVCFDVGYTGGGDTVYCCESAEQMIGVLSRLLKSKITADPKAVPTAEETAAEFLTVYVRTITDQRSRVG